MAPIFSPSLTLHSESPYKSLPMRVPDLCEVTLETNSFKVFVFLSSIIRISLGHKGIIFKALDTLNSFHSFTSELFSIPTSHIHCKLLYPFLSLV